MKQTTLALTLALLLGACSAPPPPAAPDKRVRVLKVGAGGTAAQPVSRTYSGEIRARGETTLGFRVPGKLIERLVDAGAVVKPGQPLARLDATDAGLQATAAEAQQTLAKADATRYRELKSRNFVSQAALDARETALQAAQAQAALARNQTQYGTLRADRGGVIGQVLAEPGQVVSAGQPIVRLAADGEREVSISIPETELGRFTLGQPAEVSLWSDAGKRLSGKLREISPVADPQTRTYAARVSLPGADPRLPVGLTASVRFAAAADEAAAGIVVPLSALFQQGTQPAVWLVADDGSLSLQADQCGEFWRTWCGRHRRPCRWRTHRRGRRQSPGCRRESPRHRDDAMKGINLSEWSLKHPQMVMYLMVVFLVGGVISYFQLGRAEDPDFTFKVMVVRTLWPGATAAEVELELTERIEKKLAETPWVDIIRSSSKPGESLVIVLLKDYAPKAEVPEAWRQVRKKLDDLRFQLPSGVIGPFPNDEFGDVQIKIFALTASDANAGFGMGDLRREAERLARELRRVTDVKKVEMIGVQDEKIYLDVSPTRLAAMGLQPTQIFDALQRQNAMVPAGLVETGDGSGAPECDRSVQER